MQNDFEQRYLELLERADIISSSPVKGCPVLKAYGYKIWEMIQKNVDTKLKTLGYENMYFPQFIPISLLKKQKEEKHSGQRTFFQEKLSMMRSSLAMVFSGNGL